MTNTVNKRNALLIIIILVATLVASVFIVFNSNENTNIVEAESIGANGVVATNYISPYKSISGAIEIKDESTLNTFLTTAGTSSAPVYGYLTASFETSRIVQSNIVDYHYLDGAGFTITLTNSSGSYISNYNPEYLGHYNGYDKIQTSSSSSWVSNGHYMPDVIGAGYANIQTPFGYSDNDNNRRVNLGGYFGGAIRYSEFMNLKVKFDGKFLYRETWGQGMAWGLLFGYAIQSSFNNMNVVINGRIWFAHSTTKDNVEGAATVSAGGYFGVMDRSNITNSYIEITQNGYISVVTRGRGSTIRYGYPRGFSGGMTGCLTNASKIINTRCAGDGSVFAWGQTPTQDSDKNRMSFAGMICGSNLNASAQAYTPGHINAAGASACGAGVIDGIISSWTGMAVYYIGNSTYAGADLYKGVSWDVQQALNDGTIKPENVTNTAQNHYYAGCLVGGASGASVSNIYYTYSQANTETIFKDRYMVIKQSMGVTASDFKDYVSKESDVAAVGFSPVGFTEAPPSPNFVNLQVENANGEMVNSNGTYSTTQHSIINAMPGVVELQWDGFDKKAKVEIAVDLKKANYYKDGMFVWNFSLQDANNTNQISEINRANYMTNNSIDEVLNSSVTFDQSNFMSRYATGLNIVVQVKYGYVATYELNGEGDTPLLGTKTYNRQYGLQTTEMPTLILKTKANAGGSLKSLEVAKYTDNVIYRNASNTLYKNEDIWTVYKGNSLVPNAINQIFDAADYELHVYNQEDYSLESKFDFLDETNKIVAYRVDNIKYDPDNRDWRPYYKYKINQKPIDMQWQAVAANSAEGITFVQPISFTYFGQNVNFNCAILDGQIIEGDVATTQMTYYLEKFLPLQPGLYGQTYYTRLDDGTYQLIGEWNASLSTEETYYKRELIPTTNIKDAGKYIVEVSRISNENYKVPDSIQNITEIVVYPRSIEIEFKGLGDYIYTSFDLKANYAVTNVDSTKIYASTAGTVTEDPYQVVDILNAANIKIKNVFDSTAITFVYTEGNDYQSVGTYTVEISLTSGNIANNYILPNTLAISSDEVDWTNLIDIEVDESNKVIGLTRTIEIKKAELFIVRPDVNGDYASELGRRYRSYSSSDATANILFNGQELTVYKENEQYIGYNSIPAIMMGVSLNRQINGVNAYKQVYCNYEYFEAELVGDRYQVKSGVEPVVTARKVGTYIARATFNTIAYPNYIEKAEFLLYEVTGIPAEVTVSFDNLQSSIVYDAEDRSSMYTNFASVAGLMPGDIKNGIGINYWFYKANPNSTSSDTLTVEEVLYERITEAGGVVNAAKYLVVVGDNINRDNYNVTYMPTDCQKTETGYPYYAFEITSKEVKISITGKDKIYTNTLTSDDIVYEILDGFGFCEKDEIVINFTSDGFAENAKVNETGYSIFAQYQGNNIDNYSITITNPEAAKVSVNKKPIQYNVGEIRKVYGNTFDPSTINTVANGILVGDTVTAVYTSEGFIAEKGVGDYNFSITLEGADKDNYEAEVQGKLVITKRELRVDTIIVPQDVVYDNTAKTVTVVFDNIFGEDVITPILSVNGSTANAEMKNAGIYTVNVTGIAEHPNYSFIPNNAKATELTINKKPIEIQLGNFTMVYTSGEVIAVADVYTIADGAPTFFESDVSQINIVGILKDSATLNNDIGTYTAAIDAQISGDKASNYEITISKYGDLEITPKQASSFTLKKASSTYTGSDLSDDIQLDLISTEGLEIEILKDGQKVTEVINPGRYTVKVTITGGNYVGEPQELPFEVRKATLESNFITNDDIDVYYNRVIIKDSKVSGFTVEISEDGKTWVKGNTLTFSNENTTQKVYIKLSNDYYFESAMDVITVTLPQSPKAINDALAALDKKKFTFADIKPYKDAIALIDNVREEDKGVIDLELKQRIEDKYNALINATKGAISTAKGAGQTITGKEELVKSPALVASSTAVLAAVGLLFAKKKKNQEEDE